MNNLISLTLITEQNSEITSTNPCRTCVDKLPRRLEAAIETVRVAYLASSQPWFLGFSGGKDSSALLKVVYEALCRCKKRDKPVTVVYCDTGVEIPVVASMVRKTLKGLSHEARQDSVPLLIRRAKPDVADTFFVRVIGRGYPPPTNKFRWCTDRLRIDPVRRVIGRGTSNPSLVLLGTRRGESTTRNKTLSQQQAGQRFYYRQTANPNVSIFAPLVEFSTSDVWSTLFHLPQPRCLDAEALLTLYRSAGADCPIIRDPKGSPCGAGRFGCWTCTVVRKDKAVESLVDEGHSGLAPLLDFRNWLAQMRDRPENRCRFRRNGVRGKGPLTLAARRQILRRLRSAERRCPWSLLTIAEEREIHRLWKVDHSDPEYRE